MDGQKSFGIYLSYLFGAEETAQTMWLDHRNSSRFAYQRISSIPVWKMKNNT